MDWVKKNWILLVCGVLAIGGIALGSWALTGFKQIQAEADQIASIATQLEGQRTGAANEPMILEAQRNYRKNNEGALTQLEQSRAINKRTPLLGDEVFPSEKKPDSSYNFRIAYRAEMLKLPEILKAGKAPNAAVIESALHRMEDKARKEANLTVVGEELKVPRPPQVQPWTPASPAARIASSDRGYGGEPPPDRDRGFGGEAPPSRGGDRGYGGEAPPPRGGDRGYGGEAPPDFRRGPVAGMFNPVRSPAGQASGGSPEQLRDDARKTAIYQVAKGIWTYYNDDSFETHPLGLPDSVDRPRAEDLWAAQVFLWIEQDIAQALRRVNDQAAEALPQEQRWVANLPVKHLVQLRISDYVGAQTTAADPTRGATAVGLLHRSGGMAYNPGNVRFGQTSMSFTDRGRSDQFDVVHVFLNLVVDARQLPRVLQELCQQNFITPIQVQYRAVEEPAATNAGYLYGAAPVLNVDIVCEYLFLRSIYDSWMPQAVKDILDGKTAGPAPDSMMR